MVRRTASKHPRSCASRQAATKALAVVLLGPHARRLSPSSLGQEPRYPVDARHTLRTRVCWQSSRADPQQHVPTGASATGRRDAAVSPLGALPGSVVDRCSGAGRRVGTVWHDVFDIAGLLLDPLKPGAEVGVWLQVEPGFVGKVRLAVDRYVGDGVARADKELVVTDVIIE